VLPVLPLIAGQYAIKMGVTLVSLPLIYSAGPLSADRQSA
jgi:hypothetical protein